MKCIVIHPDGTKVITQVLSVTLAEMQEMVGGGLVEPLNASHYRNRKWRCVFINEEGKLRDMQPNSFAMRELGWANPNDYLVGPVVMFDGIPAGW